MNILAVHLPFHSIYEFRCLQMKHVHKTHRLYVKSEMSFIEAILQLSGFKHAICRLSGATHKAAV